MDIVFDIFLFSRVFRFVFKVMGRGVGDKRSGRGRKEAVFFGELMGVSGEY